MITIKSKKLETEYLKNKNKKQKEKTHRKSGPLVDSEKLYDKSSIDNAQIH